MPFLTFHDRRIYYHDQGSGPCLLFVHEWNGSSLYFRKLYPSRLNSRFRTISLDLPGCGSSEAIDGLQFEDLPELIDKLLDFTGVETCTLMGFCLGASVIMSYSHLHPDRVTKLVLVEPVIRFPLILMPLLIPRAGAFLLRQLATRRWLFSLVCTGLVGSDRHLQTLVFRGIGKCDPSIAAGYLRMLFQKSRKTRLEEFTIEIRDKCLCIIGEKSSGLFYRNLRLVSGHFGIKQVCVLSDARHFGLIEQPEKISSLLLGY